MLNFIYLFLSFGLVFLSPVYSGQSGVADDFRAMLKHPEIFSINGTFATRVTRPFVKNPMQDMSFFSDPKTSRPKWNEQYKNWSKTQDTVSPLKIFETMGISRQGLLNNNPSKYRNLSKAQTQGMLRIIKGDLGFKDRSCARDEEVIMVRELLNMGHLMSSDELSDQLKDLENIYSKETDIARKQHIQISSLLLLQGADSQIEKTGWYLDGLHNAASLLERIYNKYADMFLSDREPLDQEHYKQLVMAAAGRKWDYVDNVFRYLIVGPSNAKQHSVLGAIRRLNAHYQQNPGAAFTEALQIDNQTLNMMAAYFAKAPSIVSPEIKIEGYIANSRISQMFAGVEKEELSCSLRKSLSTWVQKNGNKWPDNEKLEIAEQFFWNIAQYVDRTFSFNDLVNLLFNVEFLKHPRDWKDFKDFTNPYLAGVDADDKPLCISALFPIYQAFANEEERDIFIAFCNPYLAGVGSDTKPYCIQALLPIYQAFESEEDRKPFIAFCDPYVVGMGARYKPSSMRELLPIYLAFASEEGRKPFITFCNPYLAKIIRGHVPLYMEALFLVYQTFETQEKGETYLAFCNPYLAGMNAFDKPSLWKALIPIYQAFESEEDRKPFIAFCDHYLAGVEECNKPSRMKALLPIYQAFESEEDRKPFIAFCDHYLAGVKADEKPFRMKDLLPIYLADRKEDFELFIRVHSGQQMSQNIVGPLVSSYLPRSYLRYMRVHGALKAEGNPDNRRQPMYETKIENPLPVLYAQDPFLQQARNANDMMANAHDFDAVYELERPILWGLTDHYNNRVSSTSRTIHNGEGRKIHNTNEEVEDFIGYLDSVIVASRPIKIDTVHLEGTKVVSIIKQMLGLEPKSGTTRGGFAPYLSSSMYYAKPESPKGDEMLGRTWFYIKNLPGSSQDIDDYKKSVVLALLEAAEISVAGIDTHCQTRITGELMKLVSQTLPGSHLRPLIMGTDLPLVQADADIRARITAAPLRAQQLFKNMKREDSGNLRKLIEHQNEIDGNEPELWQRYEAYYDDLYRRTKTEDGNGYRLDEHILMRDDRGNLVSKFNIDGSLRATPVIVYYQSEFQVLEKVFTELMRKEFEEQRGLTY